MASIIRTDALQNLNTSNLITQTNATTVTIGAAGQTVTMPGSVNLPTGSVGISQLSATGTPTSSNFLRGDNTWNAPQAGFSGATENAVSSSPLTLTSASTQYQKVQISSTTNNYVTLPKSTLVPTVNVVPLTVIILQVKLPLYADKPLLEVAFVVAVL